jgi:addiction module HigA family antidote
MEDRMRKRDTKRAVPAAARDLAAEAMEIIRALPEGGALPPVHPGEILLEEFIRPHNLTPIRTAKRLGVPRTRIERLVAGVTPVTEDTALRLEQLFGSSAEFWLGLQADYDLIVARGRMDPSIKAIEPLAADRAA